MLKMVVVNSKKSISKLETWKANRNLNSGALLTIQYTLYSIRSYMSAHDTIQGCRKGGGGSFPLKSGQGAKKGHIVLTSFGISTNNQYSLITLLPAQSNFTYTFKFFHKNAHSDNHLLFRINFSMIFLR